MSDNRVQMRIPWSNPLFEFVRQQNFRDPIPYVQLKVGDVEARLALAEVRDVVYRIFEDPDDEDYLDTEWRLLRAAP